MPADLNDYFNKNNNNSNKSSRPKVDFSNLKLPDFNKFSGLIYTLIIIIVILVVAKPFVIINSG